MNTYLLKNRKRLLLAAAFIALGLTAFANTSKTVSQVTTAISLSDAVDYHITSSSPFTSTGSIDITNTDHAVVILDNVKPSAALNLLQYIKINGAGATNNTTCQVKIYNQGSIIMPYSSDVKPLTVYSEKNFGGTAVNDFGTENTSGFMNTLTDDKLNNKIRSFKLKRGYMVTFSTRKGGYGYSRCFVADTEDLEMAELPGILDRSISSYRIFKWNDTGKKGLANSTDATTNSTLNTTWCYSFGLGEDTGNDRECVPHHIYESWPAISDCGNRNYTTSTPTMKTNNEPGNTSDDHPQTVAQVLANWQQLMATGLRLCSPSSHDGSLAWMKEFMDSIDARGWRCDVVDIHSYWTTGQFYNLPNWYSQYKRPLWISEWCWGASWNKNGVFSSSLTDDQAMAQNATNVKTICELMNSYAYVERYAYWNSEANRSKLYLNGALTAAGTYYAEENAGVGYNKQYAYTPTLPKAKTEPKDLVVKLDQKAGKAVLTWSEVNGEYNTSMTVQRMTSTKWEDMSEITLQEDAATYTFTDASAQDGYKYRIHIIYADGTSYYSNTFTAVPDKMYVGDTYTVNGTTYYLGGNIMTNGNFLMGTLGWTNAKGTTISQPKFQVLPVGGYENDAYLQAYSNDLDGTEGALKTVFDIEPNSMYYFSAAIRLDGVALNRLGLSSDGSTIDSTAAYLSKSASWSKTATAFNSSKYSKAILSSSLMASQEQLGQLQLARLFNTEEEAIADGITQERKRAEIAKAYNTVLPKLNKDLDDTLAITVNDAASYYRLNVAIDNLLESVKDKKENDQIVSAATKALKMELPGTDDLKTAIETFSNAATIDDYYNSSIALAEAYEAYLPYQSSSYIQSGDFPASTVGWTIINGTYKSGEQQLANLKDKTCWKAFWNSLNASTGENNTMAIRQQVTGLQHGIYGLECKAATQHYCLSDQHGYLVHKSDSLTTPLLSSDYLDLPTIDDETSWQTLITDPIYINDGDTVQVGFIGSKKGATDNAWIEYGNLKNGTGDNREGWWAATDFVLKRIPAYKRTITSSWTTICLPYAAKPTTGMKFYQIAGFNADKTKVCLEEITETPAGVPCIVYSDHPDLTFMESGDAVTIASTGNNSLRGFLKTSARAPLGTFVLDNGSWKKVETTRPYIDDYTAIIYKEADVTVLSTFTGLTMDITGTTSGIQQVSTTDDSSNQYYSLDGQHQNNLRNKGLYIQVNKQGARKVIKK